MPCRRRVGHPGGVRRPLAQGLAPARRLRLPRPQAAAGAPLPRVRPGCPGATARQQCRPAARDAGGRAASRPVPRGDRPGHGTAPSLLRDPARPGHPAPPASYFSDLRALALLACSTWPAARHLSPDEDAASAVDQHIDSLQEQAAARHAGTPGDASRPRIDFSFPPADAAASGGLAHIADRILAGSRDDVRAQLLLLLPFGTRNAGQSRWGLSMARMAIPCSEGLQAAYAPVLRTFTKTGGPRGR